MKDTRLFRVHPRVTGIFTSAVPALLCAYVLFRLHLSFSVLEFKANVDTLGYFKAAGLSFFSHDFWLGDRAFSLPLIYKMAGLLKGDHNLIVFFQTLVSSLCWTFLAFQSSRLVRIGALKPVVLGLVLVFSLHSNIIAWDTVLLSESLSLSLMSLLIGCWLMLLRRWSWKRAGGVLAASFFWCFTRDSNAVIVLSSALAAAAAGVSIAAYRRYLVVASVLFLFCIGSWFSSGRGMRWAFPLHNVITQRILTDPRATAYFADRGMPVTADLAAMAGKWGYSDNGAFFHGDQFARFRAWFYPGARRTYLLWLFRDAGNTLKTPFNRTLLDLKTVEFGYAAPGFSRVLPDWLEDVVYPTGSFLPVLLVTALASIVALVAGWHRMYPGIFVPLFLLASMYPHAFTVWHGDTMEIERHALQIGVQFSLGVLLFAFMVFDRALAGIMNSHTRTDRIPSDSTPSPQ